MNSTSHTHIDSLSPSGGAIRLVQLTDAHLYAQFGGTLLGMDTDESLQCVVNLVNAERPAPDVLLLTGDLSDHGSANAYARMRDYSAQITDSCYWLPGNHDDRQLMEAALAATTCLSSEVRIGNWQIVLLDSQVPGCVGGELGDGQLSLLEKALEQASRQGMHTLVCLHHHPVPIGSAWLDEQIVADAEAFFAIVDRYPGVKGILWGHIHQQIDEYRNNVALMGSPSTCVQFAPGTDNFKADDTSPGYRWLELGEDGSIASGVSRVQGVEFTVDLDSQGYL
ncbi:MAG: 3',5'-cyclic-AMP phosphodiesterase [Halioglobus sp.]